MLPINESEFISVEDCRNKTYSSKELGERLGGLCGNSKDGYLEFFHTDDDKYVVVKTASKQRKKIIRYMNAEEKEFYCHMESEHEGRY